MSARSALKNLLPSLHGLVFGGLRRVGAELIDAGAVLMGERDPSIPPTHLHFVGHGSFTATGYEFLRYFTEFGGLKPTDRVLDVGCGIGRMAIPLANFLRRGHYHGIDIVPEGITWCQQNITTKHPNFKFDRSDIYNKMYNPDGRFKASEYRFPFDDSSFDFVFLTSVFTHLLREDAAHYLTEIGRVLRPEGRVLGTWFLLNEESRQLVAQGRGTRRIVHPIEGTDVMLENLTVPEAAVGFDQALVQSMHQRANLEIEMPIRFGEWCGRSDFTSYQDIVVARRLG